VGTVLLAATSLAFIPGRALAESPAPSGIAATTGDCERTYTRLGGAFYTRYDSGEHWERYAKVGPYADVLVALGDDGDRLVFWRGASYLPFFETAAGKTFFDPSQEVSGDGEGRNFDKMNQHSHVRIIEDSEARVIVEWRYIPDFERSGPEWWTEEYFAIYPDGSVFRTIMRGSETHAEYEDPSHPIVRRYLLTDGGIRRLPDTPVDIAALAVDRGLLERIEDIGFNRLRGHFALAMQSNGVAAAIGMTAESDIINPSIVVHGWGDAAVRVGLNGQASTAFRSGTIERMDGTDLVLWLHGEFPAGSRISVEPLEGTASPTTVRAPVRDPYASEVPLLPEGSSVPGRFGAYYTTLKYWDEWDRPWRVGDSADIVVQFDQSPDRLVFWRGTTYVPHWVNERNIWYGNEFCERRGRDSGIDGLCEPMQDHDSRFSRVRVIDSTPARVVVHWRYAPTNLEHQFFGVDETGWGDWVDDYYTIYPDETAVRDTTLYTSKPNVFNEWHEAIPLVNPGMIPEDILEPRTLAMANAEGHTRSYDFTDGFPPNETFEDGLNILLVRIKGKGKPFAIAESAGQWFDPISRPGRTHYNHYDDWPAWPEKYRRQKWERHPEHNYREFWRFLPSHSSLMHLDWDNYESDLDGPVVFLRKILLNGMTAVDDVTALVPLTRFWENAPLMKVSGYGFSDAVFEKSQKAYILDRRISWIDEMVNRDDDRKISHSHPIRAEPIRQAVGIERASG
jgi:hypothetical protein